MKDLKSPNNRNLTLATKDEKTTFIIILCTLAAIDNKIKPEEMDYITTLASEIDIKIPPSFFKTPQEVCLQKAAEIKNRQLALELLKNMFALAYTDETFSDSEREFIITISEALNIPPQKVNEISAWIVDRIIWLQKASLIFENTQPHKGERK